MAFAGLYDIWHDAEGRPLETYTIITTAANDLVAPIHDRMPVILPHDAESVWLDPGVQDTELLRALLRPCVPELEAYAVSRRVNSVRQNDPTLLERKAS